MAKSSTATVPMPRRVAEEVSRWPMTLKIGSAMMAVIVLAGMFAPILVPYDPYTQDLGNTLLPPSLAHPFGTDNFGRDVLTRVLYGIRIDLPFGFLTTYVPMIYGVVLGALAGYAGGFFDSMLMRVVDVTVAFPFLVLIIVIRRHPRPRHSEHLPCHLPYRLDHVCADSPARKCWSNGTRTTSLPPATSDMARGASSSAMRFPMSSIHRSSSRCRISCSISCLCPGLSFLGLGVSPPTPEWGAMIAEGSDFLFEAWWISTLPGLALVVTGTALCLVGDGLAQRFGERRHALI